MPLIKDIKGNKVVIYIEQGIAKDSGRHQGHLGDNVIIYTKQGSRERDQSTVDSKGY